MPSHETSAVSACTTADCSRPAARVISCEDEGWFPYCHGCASILLLGGEREHPDSPGAASPRYEFVARKFHEEYEARAPQHGWETQQRSRVPWEDVPQGNKDLMVGVVQALMRQGVIEFGPEAEGAA